MTTMASLRERLRHWFRPRGRAAGPDRRSLDDLLNERDGREYGVRFGSPFKGAIATLTPDLLTSVLPSFNPRWLQAGVYVYEPQPGRPFWSYVTAGLSTPWQVGSAARLPRRPAEVASGLGIELFLRASVFADWPISLLHRLMAHQLGVAARLVPGQAMALGERTPLKPLGSRPRPSSIQAVITCAPRDIPPAFVLRSGTVRLIQLVGVTEEEFAWSIDNGVEAVAAALAAVDPRLVTALDRDPLPQTMGAELPAELRRQFD